MEQATYGNCATDQRTSVSYCAPCTNNEECKPGNVCEFGNCVPDACVNVPGGTRWYVLESLCCARRSVRE